MDQRKSIEWYNHQKKPNSSFRELLRNNLDKTNPRRKERTRDEATKLAKLETIAVSAILVLEYQRRNFWMPWLLKFQKTENY